MTEENPRVAPEDRGLFQQGPEADTAGPVDPSQEDDLAQPGSSDLGTGADPVNTGRPDQ